MSDNNRSPEPLTPFPFETSDDVVSADFFSKGPESSGQQESQATVPTDCGNARLGAVWRLS